MIHIGILGAGTWGIALARMLFNQGYNVRFVTIILIIGSVVYLISSIVGTNFKLNSLEHGYNRLRTHYESLLVPDDVDAAFGTTYGETVNRVKKYRNRIAVIWSLFIVTMIIAYIYFTHPKIANDICQTVGRILTPQKNNVRSNNYV